MPSPIGSCSACWIIISSLACSVWSLGFAVGLGENEGESTSCRSTLLCKEIELDSRYQFPLELLVYHCSKIEDLYQALLISMNIY